MYIYKYCSLNIAEIILSTCSIKFTNPQKFNDPFDCDIEKIFFDLNGAGKDVKMDINKIISEFKNKGSDVSFPNNKWEEIYRNSQLDKLSRSSVCCFSEDCYNTLMWAHYSDCHRGACISFNIDLEDKFVDVKSSNLTTGFVKYGDFLPVNYMEDKKKGIVNLLLTKSADWSYEKEYRIITLLDEGIFKFNPQFITSIIFGLRVSEIDIARFKRIAERSGLNITYKKSRKNGQKLEFDILH